jgi:hypothetical protein
MSAVIKLVDHQTTHIPALEGLEDQFNNINSAETPVEERLACALDCILRLRTRVNGLQQDLRQAEREVALKEALLRNAALRERELRAQMMVNVQ